MGGRQCQSAAADEKSCAQKAIARESSRKLVASD
jgi:hypothetical protein